MFSIWNSALNDGEFMNIKLERTKKEMVMA
jgi:hypothetical protein